MSFFVLPPEINSLRMFIGAGTAPMLQAASAWEGLAEELGSAAESFLSVTSGLAGQAWQGAASAAMAAAAAPYAAWLSAAAAQSAGAGGQARALASMFEAAQAATVIPQAVDANRNAFVQLVMSNLFGQNAGLIAAAEGIYEEMWAADVAAMSGYYSGASAVAAQLVPWANVLQGLPGLAGGLAGGNFGGAAGGSNPGAAGGSNPGAAGGSNPGAGGNENVGSGGSNNIGGGSNVAGGGGTNSGGVGNVGGNIDSGNTGTEFAQSDPNYGAVNAGGGTTVSPTLGAGNPGTGSFGFVPIPIPSATGSIAGVVSPATGNAGPPTQAPEARAPSPVEEVETPAPQMGVLPTAPPETAAKAAPVLKPQATQRAGSGIPASELRASGTGTTRDQQDSQPSESEETPRQLRPEKAAGKLRPREEETPRVQMRGG